MTGTRAYTFALPGEVNRFKTVTFRLGEAVRSNTMFKVKGNIVGFGRIYITIEAADGRTHSLRPEQLDREVTT